MTVQDLALNLQAAGFDADMAKTFLTYWREGEIQEQLRLLSFQRRCLLKRVHQEEHRISCLDYLVYQIQKTAECSDARTQGNNAYKIASGASR